MLMQRMIGNLVPVLFVLVLLGLAGDVAFAREVEIDYWGMFGSTKNEETAVIEAFNERYAGKYKVVPAGTMSPSQLREKLMVAIAGGNAPDVVKFDRFAIASWAEDGLLVPLDSFLGVSSIEVDDFYPAAWEEQVYKGKTYGVPWNFDVRAYLYNKQKFVEAGMNADNAPRTWEELKALNRKLTVFDGDEPKQVGFAASEGNWGFYGWLLAAGGDVLSDDGRTVTWNSGAGLQAATLMRELTDQCSGAAAIRTLKSGVGLYGALGTGKIVSVMGGSWFIGGILRAVPEAEIGVAAAPRPAVLAETPVSWSGGFSMCIPQGSKDIEAAQVFIEFFTSREAQVDLFKGASLGQLPSRRSAVLDEEFLAEQPEQVYDLLELMPYSRFRPVSPVGQQLWDIYWGIDKLIFQTEPEQLPIKQILDQTAKQGQIILDDFYRGR